MSHKTRALLCSIAASTVLFAVPAVTSPAHAVNGGTTQGCTPGFWKQSQHFDSWQEAAPSDLFTAKFNITSNVPSVLSGLTMLQALQGGGGSGLDGARLILARAAAAAYLNASYDAPDGSAMFYPWRRTVASDFGRPALLKTVREAITGTDRNAMLALARQLDADNNL